MKCLKSKKKNAVLKPSEVAVLMGVYVQIEEGLKGVAFVNAESEKLVTEALDVYHQQLDILSSRILNGFEGD